MREEDEDVLTYTNIPEDKKESYKQFRQISMTVSKSTKIPFLRGLYLTAKTNSKGISRTIYN